jgi:RNA polymerase sigma factor (sigma-70 family)
MTSLFSSALLRTQSDERLVRLARDGQERAFEVIVLRYRKPIQRYCERALSTSRAEDVVQQVLMKAWLALRDGTEVRALRPWLYRIAWTAVLETARVPGYDYAELRRSLLAPAGPESQLEQQVVIRKTLAGLAALPEAQREALLRDAFEGQSRAQIAQALGVTEGAVRQLLHRARASLRAAATAITPLPFASWLATAGSGPITATAVDGAATGSLGIAGIAKASAILAATGVVATGSGGVKGGSVDGATKARAETAKKVVVKAPAVPVSRPTPVRSVLLAAQDRRDETARDEDHGGAAPGRDQNSDSGESSRADNADLEVSESRQRDDPVEQEQRSGPSKDEEQADEHDSEPPDSGSDDTGD